MPLTRTNKEQTAAVGGEQKSWISQYYAEKASIQHGMGCFANRQNVVECGLS